MGRLNTAILIPGMGTAGAHSLLTWREEDGKSGKLPEEMTLPELKRFAEENGVDISGLKTKKEIADAIRAAEEESDADDEGADGAAG